MASIMRSPAIYKQRRFDTPGPEQFEPGSFHFAETTLMHFTNARYARYLPVSIDEDNEDSIWKKDWELGVEEYLKEGIDLDTTAQRLNIRVYFACRQIVARTNMLHVVFFNRFGQIEGRKEPGLNKVDFQQLSKEVFEAIETPGSIGYNYLNTKNFDRIVEQLEKANLMRRVSASDLPTIDTDRVRDFVQSLRGQKVSALFRARFSGKILEGIPTLPPSYSAHSLRHGRRVGWRQPELRPDLNVRGFARDGGYLY
ncbi:hypothetical protein JCM16303_005696 [Sporobolomyces ruberrimus]